MNIKRGPIPLYYQLEQDLRRRIGREFKRGDALPSEEQLSKEYGVSRITVRKALDDLAQSRLIVRKNGVGTFVADDSTPFFSMQLIGPLESYYTSKQQHLTFRVLSKVEVNASSLVAKALEIDVDTRVVKLETISRLHGKPYSYVERFFPDDIGGQLRKSDIVAGEPISRMIERKAHQRIVRATQSIDPVLADAQCAKHLGLRAGAPILLIKRTHYTGSRRPIEFGIFRYHPERYQYTVELLTQGR